MDCHFTRDKVLKGLIQLSYLPTKHQLADILTKLLPSPHFKTLLNKLGMAFPNSSLRGMLSIGVLRGSQATKGNQQLRNKPTADVHKDGNTIEEDQKGQQ